MAIQGSSEKKLEKFTTHPYRSVITQGLLFECLGNLTKEDAKYESKLKKLGKSKEEYTATLFKKINLFPVSKYNHMDLIKEELFNDKTINQKHDLFGYGKVQILKNGLDIFDGETPKDEIIRWARCDFIQSDYDRAHSYNAGLKNKKIELQTCFPSLTPDEILNTPREKRPSSILLNYIEFIIADSYKDSLEIKETRNRIIKKIKAHSLSEFAPYTAYVFTMDFLFHRIFLPEWIKSKSSKSASNWIDFNYICYAPFTDQIISDDKIFQHKLIEKYFDGKIKLITCMQT